MRNTQAGLTEADQLEDMAEVEVKGNWDLEQ